MAGKFGERPSAGGEMLAKVLTVRWGSVATFSGGAMLLGRFKYVNDSSHICKARHRALGSPRPGDQPGWELPWVSVQTEGWRAFMFRSGQVFRVACLCAVTAALIAGCGSSSSTSSGGSTGGSSSGAGSSGGNATVIPLGATMELTGAAASTGQAWAKGIELGVKAANGTSGFVVAGKHYRWGLTLDDNQSTPNQSIAQYQKFVGNQTKFIVGPTLSNSFAPAFNSLGTSSALTMTASSIASTVKPKPGQSIFVTLSNGEPSFNLAYAHDVIQSDKPKRVAILLPQDPIGQVFTKMFADYFKSQGVSVVLSKSFPDTTTDFAPYIEALKAANPDLVLGGYLDTWVQPLMKQAVSSGFTSANWMMSVGSTEPTLAATAGPIKHVYFPIPVKSVVNANDPMTAYFRTLWKQSYGAEPTFNDFNALAYYDPILMLTAAMQQAGTVSDVSKITAALGNVKTWPHAASTGGSTPRPTPAPTRSTLES